MRPLSSALRCRQIWRISFIACSPKKQARMPVLLVAPLTGMHVIEMQWFLKQLWRLVVALILPGRHVRILRVVAQGLAIRRLILLAEVAAAGFVAFQRVETHQFG